MAAQPKPIYRHTGKLHAAVPVTTGCASPGAAIQGQLIGSPIPIEPPIDGALYLAAEIIWPEIWPAAHNRELWLTGPDGTYGMVVNGRTEAATRPFVFVLSCNNDLHYLSLFGFLQNSRNGVPANAEMFGNLLSCEFASIEQPRRFDHLVIGYGPVHSPNPYRSK